MQTSATMTLSSISVRAQVLDRAMDEVGAVVDRLQADALRQAGGDLVDLELEVVDDVERVLAVARHRDAGDDFAFAVQLGDAAALVRHQLDARHVAQEAPAFRPRP